METEGQRLHETEEAFTSENWIVRIYKVKKEDSLGRGHTNANAFEGGRLRRKVSPAQAAQQQAGKGKKRPSM